MRKYLLFLFSFVALPGILPAQVAGSVYLSELKAEMQKKWPGNRTVNIVFHGHSVPSGYFVTPDVNTLGAYPHLLLKKIKEIYPYTVTNTIVTAIGGENSMQGAARFDDDVLTMKPDLILIDYSLNDRDFPLEKVSEAWESMIKKALDKGIPVILLTPTPDTRENILDSGNILAVHTRQVIGLAEKYRVGLVDSYNTFKQRVEKGEPLESFMSQINHPNEKGHELVAGLIMFYLAP